MNDATSRTVIDPETGHPQKWQILAIMCTCLVLVVAAVSSLNIAIPPIISALEPSQTEQLWIVDSYALVFAGFLLPAGAIGDRYGRKGALLAGLALFAICAVWASYSDTAISLITARAAMGLGAALIMPATLSILTDVFPPNERVKAIAVWAGFAGAGGAVGVIGGGLLLEAFWWGSVFFVNVPIAVAAFALIARLVPTSRDDAATPLDLVGSLLSIAGLGSLVYAIIEGGEHGWAEGRTIAWFVAAAVLLVGWIRFELHTPHPMLDPRFFKVRPFAVGSFTITAAFAVMFGMFFLLTQYLQFTRGHSPLGAGVRMLPFAATMIVVAPRSPAIAGRIGNRGAITAGLLLQTAGFVIMALHEPDTAYAFSALGFVLMATGMAVMMPAATGAILGSLPQSKAGVGSAVNDTTREVGGALGIAVLGTIMASGYRSSLGDATDGLPEPVAEAAGESVGTAFRAAQQLDGPAAIQLMNDAGAAFTDGMSLAFTVAAVVSVVSAAVVWSTYPAGHGATPRTTEEIASV